MDNVFFDTYIWPALIVTAHSLAIILALLVSLASLALLVMLKLLARLALMVPLMAPLLAAGCWRC